MTQVLIIGANGQIAQVATKLILTETDAHLTLFLRRANRLKGRWPTDRTRLIDGDAKDVVALTAAMQGQDVVYANLSGDMGAQAKAILLAMKAAHLNRLIFVSSMGIYDEVPGQRYKPVLDPYRDAALAIEASDMNYTILRPAWLNDDPVTRYGITHKGEPFKNPGLTVSRQSVASLILRLVTTPGLETRQSLGIHGLS